MVIKTKGSGKPTTVEMNALASLFNQGQLDESLQLALEMTRRYPKHGFGWKVLGAISQQQGLMNEAFHALKMAAEFLPKDSEAQYNLGNYFYDQHLLSEAASCYHKAVKLDSGFAMAHYNLGSVLKDQGLFAEAIVSYKKALNISPDHASMNFNLALMLYEQGDFSGAIHYYQCGLALQPDFVMAHVILAASFKATGALREAETSYRKALSIDPNCFDAHNNLGVVLNALGDLAEAENCYRTAIKLEPNFASAYNNLGVLFKDQGRIVEAEASFITSIEKDPLYSLAHNNLAVIYRDQGRLSESELSCRNAIKVKPDYAEAYSNLGLALDGMGRLQEAESAFEKALEYDPENASMLSNFSVTLNTLSQLTRAETYLKKALKIAPEFVNAHVNLCVNYLAQGCIHDAEAICLKALKIQPDNADAQNNLLFLMNYSDSYSADDCFDAARQYGFMVAGKVDAPFTSWRCESQPKRLRIGLVSGDLRQHAVSYFLENLVKHIEPSSLELIAYSTNARQDEVTARLKPYFSGWTSLVGLSDKAAAKLIHNDGIHLLLDLSGHSAGNRLPIFAWKPAPVQVSWLGYFATTGVEAMDYFIADEVGVPECNKSQFVERIKYLPDTRLCFTPPDAEVAVSVLPALANGYVTFGCFQNMAKVGDDVLDLWAEVMRGLPHSKLRWQCKSFRDASVAEGLKKRLLKRGIQPDRIVLFGSTLREAYFSAHAEVDMMLDTFPFTGGTTTCEALWMGVPTLTFAGNTLIARQGASLMSAAGLADWVAESKDEYVNKALFFAGDLEKLANLRVGLRQQALTSPLFDASRFARNMENVLWEMWRDSQNQPEMNEALIQHIIKDQLDQTKPHIEIISATRYSEDEFWSKSALGISLKRHLKQDARLAANIAFENTRGLAEIFNERIDQAQDDAILVFIHDDVWIDDVNFAEAVIAGLEHFDVIGVAGNRRRVPNQPAWAFTEIRDGKFITDIRSNLSGCVSHGNSAFGPESYFGEVPAECELMDGVFLATKKECLKTTNVRFDVQFDFHFYDLDFCRSARKAGLKLGTWLIKLTHQSHGAFGSQHWINKYQLYLNKWEVTSSNNGIIFLQQVETEREQHLQQAMNEVLQMAIEHQNVGRIEQAEQLYIEVLNIRPEHALANHNLGVIEANVKGALVALPRLEIAVKASPDNEQFWVSYIDGLMQSGAPDTAADAIELGKKFGLTNETAQMLAAEYVAALESQHKHEAEGKIKRKAREHQLAHQLLDGMQGLEIGGAAHNAFGLNTRNVDYTAEMNTAFKLYEVSVCGEAMTVDIVAKGDDIPLPDKSVDFVISSHVIEHFFDPIKAIKEWMRLSRKYVFIIAPLPDALPSDRGKPLTTMPELLDRHSGKVNVSGLETEHYSIWTCETFRDMCLEFIGDYGFHISHFEVVDTKVGNGFTVVLRHNSLVETAPDLQRSMNEMLQMALEHQNLGQIEQAKHLYLDIINIQPNHADANHNLGVIKARLKGAAAALPNLEIAIMAKPENEQFWVSYIDALMQSGADDNIVVSALELGQQCGGLRVATVKMLAAEHIATAKKQSLFCPVCNCQQVEFSPLPDSYQEIAHRHGFIHFGQGEMTPAETYTCCNCGASDRERLYALWINQQIEKDCFSANTRVIHFAPEAVLSAKLKSLDLFDYKTADLFMDRVDYKVDMMDMPFKDARFDFFICSHVLEHVSSDDQAIKELYRITKLGGSGILMAPIVVGLEKTQEDSNVTDEESRCRLYGQNDHVRLYAHNDYVNKIRSHGFRVDELGIDYFGEEIFISLGLKPSSILYVVRK